MRNDYRTCATIAALLSTTYLTFIAAPTLASSGAGACTALTPPASTTVNTTTTLSPDTNLQNAIDSAGAGTLLVLSPGTYNVGSAINLKSNVSLQCQCGATLKAGGQNAMFKGFSVSNVTVSNCVLDGNNGGPGNVFGAVYLDGYSSNIHVANNTMQNWTNSNGFWLWDTQQTYIQNNVITNGYQGLTWRTNVSDSPMDTMIISDNLITDMSRMGIETYPQSKYTNAHIDRNTVTNIGDMAISFVGGVNSGTCYGNVVTGNLIELGNNTAGGLPYNVTVSNNVISNSQWGFSISHSPGVVIVNNTFINVTNPYGIDGGYDHTEWIGINVVNGVNQNGWSGHDFGAKPTVFAPSAQP